MANTIEYNLKKLIIQNTKLELKFYENMLLHLPTETEHRDRCPVHLKTLSHSWTPGAKRSETQGLATVRDNRYFCAQQIQDLQFYTDEKGG